MPSGDSNYNRLRSGTPPPIIPPPPPIPDEVKERFPSMAEYEKKLIEWAQQITITLRGGPG